MSSESKRRAIESILALLRAIDGDMDRMDEAAAARLGISRTDFRCLDILSQGTAMTPGQLAAETGLSTGATTALLDRLEKAGYVKREHDSADRRRVFVRPTDRCRDEVWPIFAGVSEGAARLMSQMTAGELAVIQRFLEKQRAMIRDNLPGGRHAESGRTEMSGPKRR